MPDDVAFFLDNSLGKVASQNLSCIDADDVAVTRLMLPQTVQELREHVVELHARLLGAWNAASSNSVAGVWMNTM